MARRTETKPEVGAPPPIRPPGPWPAPPEEHRSRLGWAALAFVVVVALTAGGWFVLGHRTRHHQPTPGSSSGAPSTANTPSLPAPVPATTYQAFAALSSDQRQAVMEQVMKTYNETVGLAVKNLDPSLLPRVATGDELTALQTALNAAIQKRQPVSDSATAAIRAIVMSPQPYSFVSIDVLATETSQYLDPATLQPLGTPSVTNGRSSFSLVIEGGVWKVSEHIQETS